MKKLITYLLLSSYLFCVGQLGLITMFHEQIHKLSDIASDQKNSEKKVQEDDCDGNCGIMKNSNQQDDNSKSQNSQKSSLSDLSVHNTSFFSLNSELKTTLYFPQFINVKYSAPFRTDTPPPRFS